MMLEVRNKLRVVGSRKAADATGVDVLAFIAEDPKLFQRFLDMSGLEVAQLRAEAAKPAFFVDLLDFILAHEPTTMDFDAHAGLNPPEVQIARDALTSPSPAEIC